MGSPPFVEIRLKRAMDLTDADAIRFSPEEPWREIMDVYRTPEEVEEMFGCVPWDFKPHVAYLDNLAGYVVVRVLIQEKTSDTEIVDEVTHLYGLDLFEVQSLPVRGNPGVITGARGPDAQEATCRPGPGEPGKAAVPASPCGHPVQLTAKASPNRSAASAGQNSPSACATGTLQAGRPAAPSTKPPPR